MYTITTYDDLITSINNKDDTVISIILKNIEIESIPSSIDHLINVERIVMENVVINSAIPVEIGNLSNLKVLLISKSKIVGTIPEEIGNLHNLMLLYFKYNHISSTIPSSIGDLPNLMVLCLCENDIYGAIPQFNNIDSLIESRISNNRTINYITPIIE